MLRKNNSKKLKEDKSIAEIEAELAHLQKDVDQKTSDVKKLLEFEVEKYSLEQVQAEFFAGIATLNTLISNFEEGRIDLRTYNNELQTVLNDISKFKLILERKNYDVLDFIRKENIQKKFHAAYKKLKEKRILF